MNSSFGCHTEAVAFDPDGRTLLTGSDDTSARVWQVPAPALVDRRHPDRLRISIEVRTGRRRDGTDDLRFLSLDERDQLRRQLDAMGGPCDAPTWEQYDKMMSGNVQDRSKDDSDALR